MGDFLIESLHTDVKEKRNSQWHLLKNHKADFIHNHKVGVEIIVMRFFQWEERQGQTPDTTKITGNLWPRSRMRFSGWKITKKHQGKWRFWLNQPNIILAEGGPGWSDIISGIRQDEETNDQISWVIRCWRWLNWSSTTVDKSGQWRHEHGHSKSGPSWEESSEERDQSLKKECVTWCFRRKR